MVLENLGQSLRDAIKKIANASHVDQKLVKEVVKDVQRALLQADVNVKLVLSMTKELESRALTEKPPPGMSSREHVIRIVYEELVKILGKPKEIPAKPQRILMVGLYGQGKTTTTGKIGKDLQKRGMKVGLVAADVHRPAAYDQLTQIGKKLNIPVFGDPKEKNAVKIAKRALKEFEGFDVIIFDTSGRHALEDDLIREIKDVAKIVDAEQKILILDAQTGQQAGPQAKAFHDAVGLTGVVITKLDGTAKGGGALSAVAETGAPICYIGVGEHLEDIERFDPDRFISRLLGMGDIKSLHRGRERGHGRGEGRGDRPEDDVREVHAQGDVRPDGDAPGHGPAEEDSRHDARPVRQAEGPGHGGDPGTAQEVQGHNGLHDRAGARGPETPQVIQGRQDRQGQRDRIPRMSGSS